MKSAKDICEIIWNLEKEYNLLDFKIRDIYVWQLIRYKIFLLLTQKTGIFQQPHVLKNSLFDKFMVVPRFVKNSIVYNTFSSRKPKRVLIFDHPKKTKINHQYVDIYTDHLINHDSEDNFEVFERHNLNKHLSSKKQYVTYLDYIDLMSALSAELPVVFNSEEKKSVISLSQILSSAFKIKLNVSPMIRKHIRFFKSYKHYYLQLLKIKKPEQIYVVVAYGYHRQALVAAAKELGVPVTEIQHGTITPFHLGYNYPGYSKNQLAYFPTHLQMFGKYWYESTDIPLSDDRISFIGFPFLKKNLTKYYPFEKENKSVLILSQGTIGDKLSQLVSRIADQNPDFTFYYKLHPGERINWRSRYPHLADLSRLSNVQIFDDDSVPLYSLFARSNYQMGVYSTAIFEGLAFHCKTLLFDLPGIENMAFLIQKGFARIYNVHHSFEENLQNVNVLKPDLNYIFEGISLRE